MSEKEKSAGQLLKEKLFRSPKNAGSSLSEEEIKQYATAKERLYIVKRP